MILFKRRCPYLQPGRVHSSQNPDDLALAAWQGWRAHPRTARALQVRRQGMSSPSSSSPRWRSPRVRALLYAKTPSIMGLRTRSGEQVRGAAGRATGCASPGGGGGGGSAGKAPRRQVWAPLTAGRVQPSVRFRLRQVGGWLPAAQLRGGGGRGRRVRRSRRALGPCGLPLPAWSPQLPSGFGRVELRCSGPRSAAGGAGQRRAPRARYEPAPRRRRPHHPPGSRGPERPAAADSAALRLRATLPAGPENHLLPLAGEDAGRLGSLRRRAPPAAIGRRAGTPPRLLSHPVDRGARRRRRLLLPGHALTAAFPARLSARGPVSITSIAFGQSTSLCEIPTFCETLAGLPWTKK
ncbi:hypothetical protein VULLAG_LOCUS7656 [Vulpes lagopus]